MNAPALVSQHKMFNGSCAHYRHFSESCRCEMAFTVFLPPQALQGYRVPVLYWLPDLCAPDNPSAIRTGAPRTAAEWGIALAVPDSLPAVAGTGQEAGFYIDALQAPWAEHYRMHDYAARELPALVEAHFPVTDVRSIGGYGAGGHGALQIALSARGRYAAASALAPVAAPHGTERGRKAFAACLGENESLWAQYDIARLAQTAAGKPPLLIDQGDADSLYPRERQPGNFAAAARAAGFNIQFNLRPGYGGGHYFAASFIDTHMAFHADALGL